MDIFGGVYFILYLEAEKLGLIEKKMKIFLSNFLEYKTNMLIVV